MTLIEVLISITLLSLLMTGMLWAIRIGVNSLGRANQRLLANRRITGAQKILEQQIGGLMPVAAIQAGDVPLKFLFFQGEPQSMRFVSSYSLQEASRGIPACFGVSGHSRAGWQRRAADRERVSVYRSARGGSVRAWSRTRF